MNWPGKHYLKTKLSSLATKGFWTLALVALCTLALSLTFLVSLSFFYFIRPADYHVPSSPQFTTDRLKPHQLLAVYENSPIKAHFCRDRQYKYTGASLSYEEFCHFKYQDLPGLARPVDLTLVSTGSEAIRHVTVCLLKKSIQQQESYTPSSQMQGANATAQVIQKERADAEGVPKTYICQRYRALEQVKIANNLQIPDILFLQIRLQLDESSHSDPSLHSQLALSFEEERHWLMKKVIDWYSWVAVGMSLATAASAALQTFILGVIVAVRLTQSKKEQGGESQGVKRKSI